MMFDNFDFFLGTSGFKIVNSNVTTTTSIIPTTTQATAPTTIKSNSICNFEVGINYPQMDLYQKSNITLSECCNVCGSDLKCYGFSYLIDFSFCFLKGIGFQSGKRDPYSTMISGSISTR